MLNRKSKAILLVAVLGSSGCGGTDAVPSGGGDAASDISPDVVEVDRAADEAGQDAEAIETGDAGARGEGSADAGTEAADAGAETDAAAATDAVAAMDATDGTVDATDGTVGATDGAADATDGATSDSGLPEGGDAPVEVAYVATYLGGIFGFSIDMTSGELSPVPGSPIDKGAGFYAIAVTSSGHFAYAVDYLHGTVVGYRIARSGELQPLASSPVVMGGGPVTLTVDPAERFVFVGTSDGPSRIFVYRIDPATGALSPVDHSPFPTTDDPAVLAVDPQSHFLFASSRVAAGIRVFGIGDTSGALTEVTGSPFGKSTVFGGGIAFSQVGHFLYNGGGGVNAFAYDATTGAMTDIEGSPFGQAHSDPTAMDIATDSMGGYVFATHSPTETVSAFTMDQGTGKLARIPHSPFPAAPFPYSVAVDPSVQFLFVGNDDADEVSVFTINATPGDGLRQVAHSPFAAHGLQPEFAFVQFAGKP